MTGRFTLSWLEYDFLWEHLELGRRPPIIDINSHGRTFDERAELRAGAWKSLARKGFGEPGDIHRDLAGCLRVLARPEWEVDGRLHLSADGPRTSVLVGSSGNKAAVGVLDAGHFTVWPASATGLARAIVAELPAHPPGTGVSISLPAETLDRCAARAGSDADALRRALVAAGLGKDEARKIVEVIGPGVAQDLLGTRVVTSTGGSGGYAEQVAVDASTVFRVPDEVPLDTAVALLADGRTATMMTRAAAINPGDRVLVEAAAGGVGSLIVQLAKAAGASVVAAVGSQRKADLATELGADVAVDYTEDSWTKRVRDAVGAVDVVFDGVGGTVARTAFELLDQGGRMVSFGLASGTWSDITEDEAQSAGVTLIHPTATPAELREYTESALAAAAEGRLRPVIGQRFPLAEAAAAHAAIQSRATVGKTLLETR